MTDEQKKARKLSAERGHIKWIKDKCLRTMDSGEDYVFISYKSDDYEQVLDEILYRTCRKYGLKVYFDVAFDDGSDSWINQFYDNMCSPHCKAMIAFISNKYYSSYATLLEMMAHKTRDAGGDGIFGSLAFLPINLEDIKEQSSSNENTGLGTIRFQDGTFNKQAEKELMLFNRIFRELAYSQKELEFYYYRFEDRDLYYEATKTQLAVGKPYLNVTKCRRLMGLICPDKNNNDGTNKAFEDAIYDKLMQEGQTGLKSVFIPDWKPLPFESVEQPEPIEPPIPGKPGKTETILLPDFLKKYNNNTFKKETFQQVRLVGQEEYAAYSTPFFNSAYPLVWSFVMKLLEERGEDYLHFVNKKNSGSKNPPFITTAEHQKRKEEKHPVTYRSLELPGLEGWSMCRHYGQYGWVNDVLRRRILELGLPLGSFSLEYIPNSNEQVEKPETVYGEEEPETGSGGEGTEPAGEEEGSQTTGGIGGPIDLDGKTGTQKKQGPKDGGYSFTLRGERYHGLILKNMMLTVFKTTLVRHPDKLDMLVESLPCLREGLGIGPNAQPSTFRAGDTIEMNGRIISIGTSLNRAQAQKYMERLIQLCGEPKENFVVDGDDC